MPKLLTVIFLLMIGGAYGLAAVACPGPFEVTQPDGLRLIVYPGGDEWNSWIETEAGYTIQRLEDGWWVYAGVETLFGQPLYVGHDRPEGKVAPHWRDVQRPVPPGARQQHRPDWIGDLADKSGSRTVSHRILVILVDFTDRSSLGSTAANWSAKVFTSTVNSVKDYFDEVSYSTLAMVPAAETHGTANDGVVGWVSVGYAHPNTGGAFTDANRQLAKDAILAADPFVNYASYDDNSDGYISISELSIVVIAAGYECAWGGAGVAYTPNVWGHRWSLDWSGGNVPAPSCDSVKVGEYTGDSRSGGYSQMGEWHQSSVSDGHACTIGIICHELGHDALALPDLYDTSAAVTGASEGVGCFCLMGSGNWGRASSSTYDGTDPVHLCAWGKSYSGFLTPIEVVRGTKSLPTIATNPTCYRFGTPVPTEYFLVENRQQSGYDRGLYKHLGSATGGLAVWHVDMSMWSWGNMDETHKLVDLEEADGLADLDNCVNRGDAGDLYYSGNMTVFSRMTNPNSNLYTGGVTRISVWNVSVPGASMTALLNPALQSGDLNSSGGTDAVDVLILADFLAGTTSFLPGGTSTGDLDYSGAVDAADLDTLMQIAAGNL